MYEGDPANFTFNGSVSIEITCVRPTNRITLHMKKLTITSKHQLVLHEIALPFYLPSIKKSMLFRTVQVYVSCRTRMFTARTKDSQTDNAPD